MIYGSFSGCFNWQCLWHHLHAWQFPKQFLWHDLWKFLVVVSIGSVFGTIWMRGSFQNSSCGMIYGSCRGCFNWQFL